MKPAPGKRADRLDTATAGSDFNPRSHRRSPPPRLPIGDHFLSLDSVDRTGQPAGFSASSTLSDLQRAPESSATFRAQARRGGSFAADAVVPATVHRSVVPAKAGDLRRCPVAPGRQTSRWLFMARAPRRHAAIPEAPDHSFARVTALRPKSPALAMDRGPVCRHGRTMADRHPAGITITSRTGGVLCAMKFTICAAIGLIVWRQPGWASVHSAHRAVAQPLLRQRRPPRWYRRQLNHQLRHYALLRLCGSQRQRFRIMPGMRARTRKGTRPHLASTITASR